MDMESGKQHIITWIKKYQYVLWVILIGVFLMLLPENSKKTEAVLIPEETVETDLGKELCEILSHIAGVGNVEVLLTEDTGNNTIYQMDAGYGQSDGNTVIIMDSSREEKGLVKQILSPVYRGAVIVCQGADSPSVRLNVVEAVQSVTGLSSDRISVLKMK